MSTSILSIPLTQKVPLICLKPNDCLIYSIFINLDHKRKSSMDQKNTGITVTVYKSFNPPLTSERAEAQPSARTTVLYMSPQTANTSSGDKSA